MRLEPTPKPDHALRVSARLITSSTILHLSADELEHAVTQEQIENPALEVHEQRICLFCGTVMLGAQCISCGNVAHSGATTFTSSDMVNSDENQGEFLWNQWNDSHEYDLASSGWAESDEDDEFDPLARIPMGMSSIPWPASPWAKL